LKGQASAKGSNLEKEEAVMSNGGVREGHTSARWTLLELLALAGGAGVASARDHQKS